MTQSSQGTLQNDDARSTVESIQAEIIRRICFLDYPPGSQLREADLALEFGVSRTPVRDAISRIKHLGLIESRNGVGTVVVDPSEHQIRHIYDMRLRLATFIGTATPMPVTQLEIDRISDLRDGAITLTRNFDARKYFELNDELQSQIADLIGNPLMRSFWSQAYVQSASAWYRVATLIEDAAASALVEELSEVARALEQRDVAAVGYVQRIHIGYGYDRIKQHLFSER